MHRQLAHPIVRAACEAGVTDLDAIGVALGLSASTVHRIAVGKRPMTDDEWWSFVGHVGSAGMLRALAWSEGAVVTMPGEHDAASIIAEAAALTKTAGDLVDYLVTMTSPASDGGRAVTPAEVQGAVVRLRAAHDRVGALLTMLPALRRGEA